MKRRTRARMLWIVSLLGIVLSITGCAERTTPPGANIVSGPLLIPEGTGGSYTLLRWNAGLTITLVVDSQAGRQCSGTGSTNDSVWRGRGSIRGQDGHDVRWRVETTDGKSARFLLNEPYDLREGTLFLIRTTGDAAQPQIIQRQSQNNLSCADDQTCQLLLKHDPAILQFIQETLQAQENPNRGDVESTFVLSRVQQKKTVCHLKMTDSLLAWSPLGRVNRPHIVKPSTTGIQ
jgi:hypothetical protein